MKKCTPACSVASKFFSLAGTIGMLAVIGGISIIGDAANPWLIIALLAQITIAVGRTLTWITLPCDACLPQE